MIDTGNGLGTVNCHHRSGNDYGYGKGGIEGNGNGKGFNYGNVAGKYFSAYSPEYGLVSASAFRLARAITPDGCTTTTNLITFFGGTP